MKVAFTANNLHSNRERGVQIVARNIAQAYERLSGANSFALGPEISYLDGEMVGQVCPLQQFLAVSRELRQPVHQSGNESSKSRQVIRFNRPPFQSELLSSLDRIVSFEVFESLWEWPIDLARARSVLFVHDFIPLRSSGGSAGVTTAFYKKSAAAIRKANGIVCVSRQTLLDLATIFPWAREKSIVVHNGFNDTLPLDEPAPSPLTNDTIHLVMLGTVEDRKNVQNVIRSLPLLRKMNPGRKIILKLVGDDVYKARYSRLIRFFKVGDSIQWHGYTSSEDVVREIQSAHVFLYPSLWEGFGMPILEAMLLGTPVVTSDLSSMPEVAGSFAEFCDPYDAHSIADAIQRVLLLTPEHRKERTDTAKEHARSFSWDKAAVELHAFLQSL